MILIFEHTGGWAPLETFRQAAFDDDGREQCRNERSARADDEIDGGMPGRPRKIVHFPVANGRHRDHVM